MVTGTGSSVPPSGAGGPGRVVFMHYLGFGGAEFCEPAAARTDERAIFTHTAYCTHVRPIALAL